MMPLDDPVQPLETINMDNRHSLEHALQILRERKHIIGKIFTNDKYEVFVEVDGKPSKTNEIYRQVGFPPVPRPVSEIWRFYEQAKARLEQDKRQLELFLDGTLTVYYNHREVPREESAAEAQLHIQSDLDEIKMWEEMIYGVQ